MATPLTQWMDEFDKTRQDQKYQTIACLEGHQTTLVEMEKLHTFGFCPRCSQPVTSQADDIYNRFLELMGEEAMLARDEFIRTGRLSVEISIPLNVSGLRVTEVLGTPFISISQDK